MKKGEKHSRRPSNQNVRKSQVCCNCCSDCKEAEDKEGRVKTITLAKDCFPISPLRHKVALKSDPTGNR